MRKQRIRPFEWLLPVEVGSPITVGTKLGIVTTNTTEKVVTVSRVDAARIVTHDFCEGTLCCTVP